MLKWCSTGHKREQPLKKNDEKLLMMTMMRWRRERRLMVLSLRVKCCLLQLSFFALLEYGSSLCLHDRRRLSILRLFHDSLKKKSMSLILWVFYVKKSKLLSLLNPINWVSTQFFSFLFLSESIRAINICVERGKNERWINFVFLWRHENEKIQKMRVSE